jgi:hypothetical protein
MAKTSKTYPNETVNEVSRAWAANRASEQKFEVTERMIDEAKARHGGTFEMNLDGED